MIEENGHRWVSIDSRCIFCHILYNSYLGAKQRSERQSWRNDLKEELPCKHVEVDK